MYLLTINLPNQRAVKAWYINSHPLFIQNNLTLPLRVTSLLLKELHFQLISKTDRSLDCRLFISVELVTSTAATNVVISLLRLTQRLLGDDFSIGTLGGWESWGSDVGGTTTLY